MPGERDQHRQELELQVRGWNITCTRVCRCHLLCSSTSGTASPCILLHVATQVPVELQRLRAVYTPAV